MHYNHSEKWGKEDWYIWSIRKINKLYPLLLSVINFEDNIKNTNIKF
jgi:hypothetical protein